jgi:hypothetical protein
MAKSGNVDTGYSVKNRMWDKIIDNPDKQITPSAIVLYEYICYLWNKLGKPMKFSLPTSHTMEMTRIRSASTYRAAFEGLLDWGFIQLIQESKNQHTARVIAVSKNDIAPDLAPDTPTNEAGDMPPDNINKGLNKKINKMNKTLTEVATLDEIFQIWKSEESHKWRESCKIIFGSKGRPFTDENLFRAMVVYFAFLRTQDVYVKKPEDAKHHFIKWVNSRGENLLEQVGYTYRNK